MIGFILLTTLQIFANQKEVIAEVERIDNMRRTMVKVVQGKVDANTFKAVCAPVGMEANKMAQKKGWKFRQVSEKYRNPKHQPTPFEKKVFSQFSQDSSLKDLWLQHDGAKHYFRRIRVAAQCLHCHGLKEKRPDFIKKKYPNDRAFNFQEGDLRGLYHVSFPLNPTQPADSTMPIREGIN